MTRSITIAVVAALIQTTPPTQLPAPPANVVELGPMGQSPYNVVRGWQKPFAAPGFAFGGNSGVFAESPDRIWIAQRGEFRLPEPLPSGYAGFAGSIKMNVLTAVDRRVWQNCLYTLDRNGNVKERWTEWDRLCEGSSGPGPHRIRISPYDPARRVWVINETFNQIYVFSNNGKQLLKTLGEKNVPGTDGTHFAKPQDVAFLPDGRILVADGLDNHRVMILDHDMNYLGEVGGNGKAPGQFQGVHAVAVGPGGRVFALDRSGGRVNVFRVTKDQKTLEHAATWTGFSLPLDLIVNDDAVWMTDLKPLRFIKLDFNGSRQYSWLVPPDLPDGYLEVHAFSVDSEGNLYGGDNQYGRTQKFVPKPDADPKLLIKAPWAGK